MDPISIKFCFIHIIWFDLIKSSTVDLKLVAKVEIASVKIEYADGTVEGGSYGYSTTKLSGKLWH